MRALVVLNGDPLGTDGWLADLAARSDIVIAADGGAARLHHAGRRPDLIVGDLDSLPPDAKERLEAHGVAFEVHPHDKTQTDGELALRAAITRGADEIVIVGAFGGTRLDHLVGNLLLLANEDFAAIDVAIVTEQTTFRALSGPGILELVGAPGDWVTLSSLSELAGAVTTDGLRYPLHRADLVRGSTRGVSNELTGRRASVELSTGLLLVAVTTRRSVASP